MSKPLVFISHKHADKDLAKVFADFVNKQSGGRVRVHLSSSWEYEGPRFGNLNAELTKALWETEALLLVYSQGDQDWSYCTYEWGMTRQKGSPPTRTVLFQCADAVPSPLGDEVRYNVRNDDDIHKFVNSFLTDKQFFPARTESVTEFLPLSNDVKRASQELSDALRKFTSAEVASKPVLLWPFLGIELPLEAITAIKGAAPDAQVDITKKAIEEKAVIAASNARAAQIFGKAELREGLPFRELLATWRAAFVGRDAVWFDALSSQVMSASQGSLPEVRWAGLSQVGGHLEYVPVVSSTRQIRAGQATQFDIWLYDFTDFTRLPVTAKMLPKSEMFFLELDPAKAREQPLAELVRKLKAAGRHRLPIFDSTGRIQYMLHRSSINEYLMDKQPEKTVTLGHLFDESAEMRKLFETSFVIVARSDTLQKAKEAMLSLSDCRDIFVTERGQADEPVVGWLTNLMLI